MPDLLRPYDFEFFRNGVLVATLAGALCGLVGVHVVLRRMSAIGHGLSHAVFGGYAASTLLGVPVALGAGAWGVASALLISRVARQRLLGADAAIGVVTTASFALGLALFSLSDRRGPSFEAALFGSVLGVGRADVVGVVVVGLGVVTALVVWHRPLLFATFDPEVAHASGVPVARLDGLLLALVAVTVLATMQVLGATLVAATLVLPASVARLVTDAFRPLLIVATAVGAGTGFVGMNASYHLDVPPGPTIVLVGTAAFAVASALGPVRRRRGVVATGSG